ncbi:unnamed protein product [Schistocephalus solidus]|uniref:LIM zinc-binding domain-containing protein n=1 Tax=Schistocephalus solidus TaxID=70667 RepID=A0A183SUS1_SCHSO|nr:unnamed protein product [Schistocephalus solidus]
MSTKCGACGKAVYAAEERRFGDQAYHKQCFKCSSCNKPVDSTTGAQHEATLYCKTCHGREFGIKGYGFGQGAGILNTEKGTGAGGEASKQDATLGAVDLLHKLNFFDIFLTNVCSIFRPAPKAGQPRTVSPKSGGCPRCGQRVYDAEKAIGCPGDLKFHKRCFRCKVCSKALDSTNICTNEDEIYCKSKSRPIRLFC